MVRIIGATQSYAVVDSYDAVAKQLAKADLEDWIEVIVLGANDSLLRARFRAGNVCDLVEAPPEDA